MKKVKAKARAVSRRAAKLPARAAPPPARAATPYLVVSDGVRAIGFYRRAFGAEEIVRLTSADGRIAHCEIRIGDASIFLADVWEGVGVQSPAALGGTPVIIHLEVDDVDTIASRAIDAGAKVIFPVRDQFYGDRAGRLQDPFGHMWILSTRIERLSPREMRRREAEWLSDRAKQ